LPPSGSRLPRVSGWDAEVLGYDLGSVRVQERRMLGSKPGAQALLKTQGGGTCGLGLRSGDDAGPFVDCAASLLAVVLEFVDLGGTQTNCVLKRVEEKVVVSHRALAQAEAAGEEGGTCRRQACCEGMLEAAVVGPHRLSVSDLALSDGEEICDCLVCRRFVVQFALVLVRPVTKRHRACLPA
jgi:hypothetical protein